jgi:hypothetical protein
MNLILLLPYLNLLGAVGKNVHIDHAISLSFDHF